MSRNFNNTKFVSNLVEERLRVSKGKMRDYILVQNVSANDIYINSDTHANINAGFVVGAGLFWERDRNAPQNDIYISGSIAALQQVNVMEGYS